MGSIYNKDNELQYFPLKLGFENVEKILTHYESNVEGTNTSNLAKSLSYIINNINRKMVIFVITDLDGLEQIEEGILKRLVAYHDMLFININDAYMTGEKAYDMDTSKYIPKILLEDRKLHELEKKAREEKYNKNIEKLKENKIQIETINSSDEI
ncbi:MAG: hypothetical protein HFJ51_05320, partial [Clostridia bacterium]|nr:hypothetical protein [Clostridia bacterium]